MMDKESEPRISPRLASNFESILPTRPGGIVGRVLAVDPGAAEPLILRRLEQARSEERRVGKECRL